MAKDPGAAARRKARKEAEHQRIISWRGKVYSHLIRHYGWSIILAHLETLYLEVDGDHKDAARRIHLAKHGSCQEHDWVDDDDVDF